MSVKVQESTVIHVPVETVYGFWRNFENLPRFMDHLKSVTVIDNLKSHWVAKAPLGTSVEWDAIITQEQRNQLISWSSIEGSEIQNRGTVTFQETADGRGTLINVMLQYEPPLGKLGAIVAKLFGEEPQVQIKDDLQRLKEVMENGQMVRPMGGVATSADPSLGRTA